MLILQSLLISLTLIAEASSQPNQDIWIIAPSRTGNRDLNNIKKALKGKGLGVRKARISNRQDIAQLPSGQRPWVLPFDVENMHTTPVPWGTPLESPHAIIRNWETPGVSKQQQKTEKWLSSQLARGNIQAPGKTRRKSSSKRRQRPGPGPGPGLWDLALQQAVADARWGMGAQNTQHQIPTQQAWNNPSIGAQNPLANVGILAQANRAQETWNAAAGLSPHDFLPPPTQFTPPNPLAQQPWTQPGPNVQLPAPQHNMMNTAPFLPPAPAPPVVRPVTQAPPQIWTASPIPAQPPAAPVFPADPQPPQWNTAQVLPAVPAEPMWPWVLPPAAGGPQLHETPVGQQTVGVPAQVGQTASALGDAPSLPQTKSRIPPELAAARAAAAAAAAAKASTQKTVPAQPPLLQKPSAPIISLTAPVLPPSVPVLPPAAPVLPHSAPVLPPSAPVLPPQVPVLPPSAPVLPPSAPVLQTATAAEAIVPQPQSPEQTVPIPPPVPNSVPWVPPPPPDLQQPTAIPPPTPPPTHPPTPQVPSASQPTPTNPPTSQPTVPSEPPTIPTTSSAPFQPAPLPTRRKGRRIGRGRARARARGRLAPTQPTTFPTTVYYTETSTANYPSTTLSFTSPPPPPPSRPMKRWPGKRRIPPRRRQPPPPTTTPVPTTLPPTWPPTTPKPPPPPAAKPPVTPAPPAQPFHPWNSGAQQWHQQQMAAPIGAHPPQPGLPPPPSHHQWGSPPVSGFPPPPPVQGFPPPPPAQGFPPPPPAQGFPPPPPGMHSALVHTPGQMQYGVNHLDGTTRMEEYRLIASRVQKLMARGPMGRVMETLTVDRNSGTFSLRARGGLDVCYVSVLDQDITDSMNEVQMKIRNTQYPYIQANEHLFFYQEAEQVFYSEVRAIAGPFIAQSCGHEAIVFRIARVNYGVIQDGNSTIPGDTCPFGPPLRSAPHVAELYKCSAAAFCPAYFRCNTQYSICCPDMPTTTNCNSLSLGQICVTYQANRPIIET